MELIGTYRPAASVTELARKVDELEEKQQEQNQQILSLLSHLAKVFEPQAVSPRRPIGFLPATAAATESRKLAVTRA